MNRIEHAFQKRPIFMPYFPVGFPDLETSIDVLQALAQGGADLIEVGLSFSDPLADGPVIQRATQVALQKGVTVAKTLAAIAELRRRGVAIPLVLMGYYNPLLAFGLERFCAEAAAVGVDGLIIPDLPPEESADLEAAAGDLPLIRMLAPTTPLARMDRIVSRARGFLYLVSVTGVTGVRTALPETLPVLVAAIRQVTALPVCVGFGIGTPQQAQQVGAIADGIIVGSACVRAIGESDAPVETARAFAQSFQQALAETRLTNFQ